jgi:hypothetical protein
MSPRSLWWMGLLALAGVGCRDQGAVKLTVSFPGFTPGCIRVGIQPADGSAPERTLDLVEPLGEKKTEGAVTVAAYREAGWSRALRVSATSFERACTGTALETRDTPVSVEAGQVTQAALELRARDQDGDGFAAKDEGVEGSDCDDDQSTVHPEQAELCNGQDDNCDGRKDEDLHLGEACREELDCGGTSVCAPDGSVTCKLARVPSVHYRDSDNDGHGAGPAEESCKPVGKGTGYASVGDDCDDTLASRYPGNPEVCDNVDNNCDQKSDTEVFALGTACDDTAGCGGKVACAANGSATCGGFTSPRTTYYLDDDGDSYGTGPGLQRCEAPEGYATRGDDCNDGNAFTNPGAAELCDGEDNNCVNGTLEEVSCPVGSPKWADEPSAMSDIWRSISLWGTDGVWVAGGNNYAVRRPGQTGFEAPAPRCADPIDLNAVWVDPSTGVALIGGNNDFLGEHTPGGACGYKGPFATNTQVQALTGVPRTGMRDLVHLGGPNRADPLKGRLGWTDRTQQIAFQDMDRPVFDVHGLAAATFAVGGHSPGQGSAGGEPRIYRYTTGAPAWVTETIQWGSTPVGKNVLRGVWVVNPHLAFAVGEGSLVLLWDGKTWAPFPSPSGNEDLLSVLSFGRQAIYVTTRSGKVLRYRNNGWSAMPGVPASKPLYDIAGKSPVDLWVVGEQGKRLHWK